MAVLFARYLMSPRERRGPYASSASTSFSSDIEEGSEGSMSNEGFNEKHRVLRDLSPKPRINPRTISDAIIGLSDGLTVPFALTAGLSALGDTNVVIYGGLAELVAGGISMGLGGYLGAKSEAEAYQAALFETRSIVATDSDRAAYMVKSAFNSYDFSQQMLNCMTMSLLEDPARMVDFLMRFYHQLAEADHTPSRAYYSGLTISSGYFFGGLVPLVPYVFISSMQQAFLGSVLVMVIALFAFGWIKTSLVGESCRWACFKNGMQMTMLGGIAAGAAMGCVKAVGS